MDLVAMSVVAGLLGTLAMDGLNLLFARAGIISRIDVGMIGRMAVGWTRGRFRYRHPSEMETAEHEMIYGIATHYAIGVSPGGPLCRRLDPSGGRTCLTRLGSRLRDRHDDGVLVLRIPFHGFGRPRNGVSRRPQGSPFRSGQSSLLWIGRCSRTHSDRPDAVQYVKPGALAASRVCPPLPRMGS